ncbi:excalibur calcium-binding domain-containing protein [Sphingomonas bisphenolicum]|uniref:Excalibur calcium-binding domain-containing protein n=1 Tax=Sphingomonas bisphenolicum TaxID=296544 RepID=A0ABN5W967_9SPHN|nr:excalibur calcium-binding domain-containing protein [Sphingomonas bisphenolicum]BBF68802.1 hypothetical protein SBA_ch1_10020 [Sphingomonas bisphenolicum]
MTFKKPFRAVPVRPGSYYAAQRRKRRQERFVAQALAGLLICAAVGAGSIYMGNEAPSDDRSAVEQVMTADTVPYTPAPLMSAAELDAQQPGSGSVATVTTPRARPLPAASGWSYRNCAQARAAGAAPLYAGQPGYGPHMDGDGDGIACEPYRWQR